MTALTRCSFGLLTHCDSTTVELWQSGPWISRIEGCEDFVCADFEVVPFNKARPSPLLDKHSAKPELVKKALFVYALQSQQIDDSLRLEERHRKTHLWCLSVLGITR
jgi:hypothetical protein